MRSTSHGAPSPGSYVAGFVLALALTAIAFGLVAVRLLPTGTTLVVIVVAAIIQIVVHLRFFLAITLARSSRDKLLTLCFAAVLIAILMGGSIWIMFDLHYRMMAG